MIYQFTIPHITDTKNLKKVFLKKKEVTKEMMVYVKREFDDMMLGILMRRLKDMHLFKTRWR
jgi:hypothetical protein